MIYLEIIELNFCGLNSNIRKAIIKKGDEEFKILSLTQLNSDEIVEENEDELTESYSKENKSKEDINKSM